MRILKTGITTIQDHGRFGFRNWGLPVGGTMDRLAGRLGNLLVGNEPEAACLEISRGAFTASFDRSCLLALTGKGFDAYISGRPISFWQPFLLHAGEFLQLFPKGNGFAYLSVHGGIRSTETLGSRSTLLGNKIGGLDGRPLRPGDDLPTTLLPDEKGQRIQHFLQEPGNNHQIRLGNAVVPDYSRTAIRFTAGTEYSWFSKEAHQLLESCVFTPTAMSNRMGSRLSGPALTRTNNSELISTAVLPGTMQVSPDGQVLLLLADAQTTGGYPRIGQVIEADLHLVAQAGQDSPLTFNQVSLQTASELMLNQEKHLLLLTHDYYLYFS